LNIKTRSRREVLAYFGKAIVLSATASACDLSSNSTSQDRTDTDILSSHEMELLGNIVDVIVPATDTAGAKSSGVDVYILEMLRTWYRPDEVAEFHTGLGALDDSVINRFGQSFIDIDSESQTRALAEALSGSDASVAQFVAWVRQMTLTGYYTSQVGASVELRYLPVPASYNPCLLLGPDDRAWST